MVTLGASVENEVGSIIIVYRAKVVDRPCTALNLTQHWGFNLCASEISKGNPCHADDIAIQDHILTVNSKEILDIDPKTSRPSGTTIDLSNIPVKDFRQGKTIGKVGEGYPVGGPGQGSLADGYCDYWIFDRAPKSCVASNKESLDVFAEIAKE